MKENITLRVDAELYTRYRAMCKKKGWIVSRQFEIFMEKELGNGGAKDVS